VIAEQKTLALTPKSRGFHLIDREVFEQLPELKRVKVGTLQLFIKHTSASLSINENADPTVRSDMEMAMNRIVPEDFPYRHTAEGPDDMPAHVKAAFFGHAVHLPIKDGKAVIGTWQGIYLGEHRDHGGSRQVVATILGIAAD
jgi:secondary thiamine-phosphate synthase enzyme